MPEFQLKYAGKSGTIKLPDQIAVEVAIPKTLPVEPDAAAVIAKAVTHPIGCPRLRDSVKPGQKVAIIVTDITRKIPDNLIIQSVLRELEAAGVADRDVKVVIATGLHRPNTHDEIVEMLGADIPARLEVINHLSGEPSELVYLGKTKRGLPMVINKHVVEADVRIATGTIEPHKLAGYSGGVKTMSVGVAGKETIAATHNLEVSDDPSCRIGVIEGNIFREFLTEVALTVRLDFIINVIQNGQKEVIRAVAGHPRAAFEEGVKTAREQSEVTVKGPADLVIAVPGYPKDRDAYQASRAMNTVIFGPAPVVGQGGSIIVPAPCQDGFGHQDVYNYLAAVDKPIDLIKKFQKEGYPPGGAPVAYKLAQIMQIAEVYYTDCQIAADTLRKMHLKTTPTIQEAIDEVVQSKKPKTALIMPYALITLPVFATGK